MNIININKLTYRYNEDFIFYNFDLSITKGSWVTISGANKSGKTTLVNILCGLIKTNSEITINELIVNEDNINDIRASIGVVFDNPENSFICDTLKEEFESIIENHNLNNVEDRIKEICNIFNIEHLLERDPHTLSGGEMNKCLLACALIHNPKILILDEALSMLDKKSKEEILCILYKYNKSRNLTIINMTHDLSEAFLSERLLIIDDGVIVLDGKPKEVMKYDKILYKVGVDLPFIVDLSNKLNSYGLIDNMYFDMREMVSDIWK